MKREVKKILKRSNKAVLFCIFIFLVLGALAGFFTTSYITKDDTFEIIGEKNITLNIDQEYQEQGAKVISFGKEMNEKVIIESNLDTSKEGEYTIVYKVNSIKYKNIQRVRYVTVVNGSDNNG